MRHACSENNRNLQNSLTSKVWGTLQKRGWKDCKSQSIRELAARWCLLVTPEATPIKSRQHDWPNVSCTGMTPMDMPNWTGKSLYREQKATDERREWETWSSPRKSIPIGIPVSNCQTWKHAYKWHYADQSRLSLGIYMYRHMWMQ